MELDLKEFLAMCVVLIIFSGVFYSLFIFDNQSQIIKVQSYVIKNQNFEMEEKENLLEEERKLDEDRDGDGLTLRQEKKLRTFDTMIDSDQDGVNDKYDEHPSGGGRMIVKHIEWGYSGKLWSLEIGIPSDVISYYEQIPRPRWEGNFSYYSEFIDPNDKGIEKLTGELKNFIDEKWDYYDKVMFVASMVQQMHYTSDNLVGFDEFSKFPMQTLNDGTGDCEDFAILAAAILKKMNYDVKFLFLEIPDNENHMAIAVLGEDNYAGTYFIQDGKKYFYVETIARYSFGEYPSRWVDGKALLIDI